MKKNYTHLALVIDRSGSMGHLAAGCSENINGLIKQQAEAEGDLTVSLYQFDTFYEKVFGPLSGKFAPQYKLEARGGTALHDSVFRAIQETGEFLRNLDEKNRPSKVVFAIVTDGQENASKEVKLNQVKESIEHQKKNYGWEFVFMASGIDAFASGAELGIQNNIAVAATGGSYTKGYNEFSTSLLAARSTNTSVQSNVTTADFRDETGEDEQSDTTQWGSTKTNSLGS